MLARVLIPKLQQHFPDRGLEIIKNRVADRSAPFCVFPKIHSDVGNVEIQDDGDEVTVFVGRFTHVHFGNYDDDLSPADKAERIANYVVEFLDAIFNDRIEFWGTKWSGGCRARGTKQGKLDFLFGPSRKTQLYVWSGPLSE
jgi:hypothetical protein